MAFIPKLHAFASNIRDQLSSTRDFDVQNATEKIRKLSTLAADLSCNIGVPIWNNNEKMTG